MHKLVNINDSRAQSQMAGNKAWQNAGGTSKSYGVHGPNTNSYLVSKKVQARLTAAPLGSPLPPQLLALNVGDTVIGEQRGTDIVFRTTTNLVSPIVYSVAASALVRVTTTNISANRLLRNDAGTTVTAKANDIRFYPVFPLRGLEHLSLNLGLLATFFTFGLAGGIMYAHDKNYKYKALGYIASIFVGEVLSLGLFYLLLKVPVIPRKMPAATSIGASVSGLDQAEVDKKKQADAIVEKIRKQLPLGYVPNSDMTSDTWASKFPNEVNALKSLGYYVWGGLAYSGNGGGPVGTAPREAVKIGEIGAV